MSSAIDIDDIPLTYSQSDDIAKIPVPAILIPPSTCLDNNFVAITVIMIALLIVLTVIAITLL